MKKTLLYLILTLCPGLLAAQTVKLYTVANPLAREVKDEPVVIPVADKEALSVMVYDGKTAIPCQMDDTNCDGTPDYLCFVLDLKAGQKKTIAVSYSRTGPKTEYPPRTFAQLLHRDRNTKGDGIGEPFTPVIEGWAGADTVYNRYYGHGPMFESELVAYRVYFDKKQTIDLYGKVRPGIELDKTNWYPSDEQLAQGMGDDVLRVFGALGVGTIRGWDVAKGKNAYIDPIEKRSVRIIASGPVRSVVEMVVKGWKVDGRSVDISTRYTLWAGHREVLVSHYLGGDYKDVTFCTGVMKMADHTFYKNDDGIAAVWGTDFPVVDTVKYGKQTLGMAVDVPRRHIASAIDDKDNYLFQLQPDERGRIYYRFTFSSAKEEFGFRSDEEFFTYARLWKNDEQYLLRAVLKK